MDKAFLEIDPQELDNTALYTYLTGAVAPRPIALASTLDADGNANLSPFSYFNLFSANPPILVFSPARRGRDGSSKDTYNNVLTHPEVVINIVSHEMVQQMSLSSNEYPSGVDEFKKAGFERVESTKVRPAGVKVAPIRFECKVNEVKPLGENGGAGNLVICEVIYMHIRNSLLQENGQIDPHQLDAVGRLGGNWYVRAQAEALFEVPRPSRNLGIGVDQLPDFVVKSGHFSGNELGLLASVHQLPSKEMLQVRAKEDILVGMSTLDSRERMHRLFELAKKCLARSEREAAWEYLMLSQS
ncbi:MAG: flavin reductase family protein [Cyclobacteriaceae bacterium]|nr:flavin reductase family protein [Cyclobacteriaceae bacterium]MCH8515225.1 flavin reductase family protein [Cyclobacteriaceae bacterium]